MSPQAKLLTRSREWWGAVGEKTGKRKRVMFCKVQKGKGTCDWVIVFLILLPHPSTDVMTPFEASAKKRFRK